MKPIVIMHNTISLDGSIKDFDIDVGLHYKVAANYNPDVVLIGSSTASEGVHELMKRVPKEKKSDFKKPGWNKDDERPYFAIVDTRGRCKGKLHVYRSSGYCRDVVVFVSDRTPKHYLKYLKDREYDHYFLGRDHIDYKKAMRRLRSEYDVDVVLVDSGPTLNKYLLEKKIVNKISLLISPHILTKDTTKLFGIIMKKIHLELESINTFRNNVLLVYKVI